MTTYLNGKFLNLEDARVSILDRGYLYGDGLFDTMIFHEGRPFEWSRHWSRLATGLKLLRIRIPQTESDLREAATRLIQARGLDFGVLRLHVSRGPGTPGYSTKGCDAPTVAMTLHPSTHDPDSGPPTRTLHTARIRVPSGEFHACIKSASKVSHVLARMEAEDHSADEALLLNDRGNVAEAASANVFWIAEGMVTTSPLREGGLGGVTRALVMEELAPGLGLRVGEREATPDTLRGSQGVFLTMTTIGVVPVVSLDGQALPIPDVMNDLYRAYWNRVRAMG